MAASESRPAHVATIPPGLPFLDTLVDGLLDGTLIDGFDPRADGTLDSLLLADVTIYVPTQRARRALAATFAARCGTGEGAGEGAALLPDIRALGDADEDELIMQDAVMGDPLRLEPVIDPLERRLLLTTLVRSWWHALEGSLAETHDEHVAVPSSLADAAWFARDLIGLMDQVAAEEADWSALAALVEESGDTARWWRLTLEFLKIATEAWPDILAERNRLDPAARHARMIGRLAESYATPPRGPVIAAGAVGTNPATSRLLSAIAALPQGLVVLPGLDVGLDNETWDLLAEEGGATHPQATMHRLLSSLGVSRGDVRIVAEPDDETRLRERIVSEALRPPDATGAWGALDALGTPAARAEALSGTAYVEAANEREEATAVALAMRETLADDNATVALVTPDRNLARRVATELSRFDIAVDDSAGRPLANTPHGRLARLVLSLVLGEADVVGLAALLKHPLVRLAVEPDRLRRMTHTFEIACLRGVRETPLPGGLAAHVEAVSTSPKDPHAHPARARMAEPDWEDAATVGRLLDEALAPLAKLPDQESFEALTLATIRTLEALLAPSDADVPRYTGEDGEALAAFLSDLRDVEPDTAADLSMAPADWPGVFEALMADRTVRTRGEAHPRAFVWGPLEARLQSTDRIVLGGLNEETWPATVRNDAFLSRPMKRALPLEPPERRIGLAAHDIQMLFGASDLVLTRSRRLGGKPTVASRWWQRIAAVAGRDAVETMRARGDRLLASTRKLDEPGHAPRPATRPMPRPPLDARPRHVSFTEVEHYIRDPYRVHARRILCLEEMEPLVAEVSVRERGNLYHAILEAWSRAGHRADAPNALDLLLDIAREHFETAALPEAVHAQWWPRFEEIAADFLDWERGRADDVRETHVEKWARLDVAGMTLRGLADRIDVMRDGSLAIVDYKTGTSPSATQAHALHAPQLALEAAAAARGAFEGVDAGEASTLAYVRLRPRGGFKADHVGRDPNGKGKANDEKRDAVELGQLAFEQFEALATRFMHPDTAYAARTRPVRSGDYESPYDHLSRAREWEGDGLEGEGA